MIYQEHSFTEDGTELLTTYSTRNFKIRQDETGILYDEAVDPAECGRTYTETDIPIDSDDETAELITAAKILFGEDES